MEAQGFQMGGASNPAAGDVPIADAGSLITGTTVEAALQEIYSRRKYVAAAGDQIATQQNVTLQNDAELIIAGIANLEVWWIEFTVLFTAASGTPDIKIGMKVTNGSFIWGGIGLAGSQGGYSFNGTGATPGTLLTETGDAAAGDFSFGSANGLVGGKVGGIFTGSGAGGVQMKFSQATSNASDVTRKAKSFVRAERFA